MRVNSSSSSGTSGQAQGHLRNSDHRFIDKHRGSVIEVIMIQSDSLAKRGFIPSAKQIAACIQSLGKDTLLRKIRRHSGAASTRALLADDVELLRWAGMLGQQAPR